MKPISSSGKLTTDLQSNNEVPMSLGSWLSEQIAAFDGVDAGEVTTEYIQNQRENRLYRDARYSTPSRYGGYNVNGLIILTRRELEERNRRLDLEIAQG